MPEDTEPESGPYDSVPDQLLDCPSCGDVTDQEVLRAADSGWTLQCRECHAVRTVPAPPRIRLVALPVILSSGATASTERLEVPLEMEVTVGDEFDFMGHRIRITALERPDGTRPEAAPGRELRILYAVVFDTVLLRYTVNEGEVTRSLDEEVAPEEQIHVGAVREVQGRLLHVKALKSDQNRTLNRGFLLARSVVRVFAEPAPSGFAAGEKRRPRHRGPSPWTAGKTTSRRGKT